MSWSKRKAVKLSWAIKAPGTVTPCKIPTVCFLYHRLFLIVFGVRCEIESALVLWHWSNRLRSKTLDCLKIRRIFITKSWYTTLRVCLLICCWFSNEFFRVFRGTRKDYKIGKTDQWMCLGMNIGRRVFNTVLINCVLHCVVVIQGRLIVCVQLKWHKRPLTCKQSTDVAKFGI